MNFFLRKMRSHQRIMSLGHNLLKTHKSVCVQRGGKTPGPGLSESQGQTLSRQEAPSGRKRVEAVGTKAGPGECGMKE